MSNWADETKQVKASFFMMRQDAERYHRNVYENLGHIRVKNVVEVQHVVEHARGSVLDVGTGTGRFAIPLHDAGHKVTGCDISPGMLEVAADAAQGRDITWQVADVEKLPFPDNSFDTVVSLNVIIHLPQWQSCIREFQRVVKPGGRIIFDMFSGDITRMANQDGPNFGYVTKNNDKSHFFAEIPLTEMYDFLKTNQLSVDAIIPHNLFNQNYLIEKALKDRYGDFNERLRRYLVESESAFRFWCFVERFVIPQLPTEFLLEYIVVAINGPGGSCIAPKTLDTYGENISGYDFLKSCLGDDFDFVVHSANALLKSGKAYECFKLVYDEFLSRFDTTGSFDSLFDDAKQSLNLDLGSSHMHTKSLARR